MNSSDSEIVESILQKNAGMFPAKSETEADLLLVNTCAIRDNAEKKVWKRLELFRAQYLTERRRINFERQTEREREKERPRPLVGVLGCMAERLKGELLEGSPPLADLVCGPDAYRDLPRLIDLAALARLPSSSSSFPSSSPSFASSSPSFASSSSSVAVNTLLSLEETYSDLTPVRRSSNRVSAFVSIQRGCDAYCSYCVVPFTRGHERSRPPHSILEEVRQLSAQGYKEVTLLGQNVNSYSIPAEGERKMSATRAAKAQGFLHTSKRPVSSYDFVDLLADVSAVDPEMRIRFISPHPKDFSDELFSLIAERPNLCKALHLPVQSGSSSCLTRMRRGYSRESYLALVDRLTSVLGPSLALSTDLIAGFCGETEEDHQETLSLMRSIGGFETAYMFAYSEREKTHAHRTMKDDVPASVKQRRLSELIDLHLELAEKRHSLLVGTQQLVLVDGKSKRSAERLSGRTDGNRTTSFDLVPLSVWSSSSAPLPPETRLPQPGDYVVVEIVSASSSSLQARPIAISTLHHFTRLNTSSSSLSVLSRADLLHASPLQRKPSSSLSLSSSSSASVAAMELTSNEFRSASL